MHVFLWELMTKQHPFPFYQRNQHPADVIALDTLSLRRAHSKIVSSEASKGLLRNVYLLQHVLGM